MKPVDVIFDPGNRLQSLRERLRKAKEDTSQGIIGPVYQAFREATENITNRNELQHIPTGKPGKQQVIRQTTPPTITSTVTDEEIKIEAEYTAKGIIAHEYGDSQNRPSGVIRQEMQSLQSKVEEILKDVTKEV